MKTYQQLSARCGRGLLTAGLFIVGLMACVAIGVSAQAQTYSVKDMGILEGMKACEPAAMYVLGQITGTATAGEESAAFLYYYNGKEDEMENVGGLGSRGFAINPAGFTVGDATFPNLMKDVSHAAIFKGGKVVDLGVVKGQVFSRANSMNATWQVVGSSGPTRDSAQSRAFIWSSATGMIDIGTLGGQYAQAYAINDSGWVTGTAGAVDITRLGATHAFIYQPLSPTERFMEPMRDLGTLGGNYSYGMAINDSKHVVGYSTINNFDGRTHAFFHSGEKMVDIGALENEGFDYSAALAVNKADKVVGVSYRSVGDRTGPNQTAFIWIRTTKQAVGQMINLNSLIGAEAKNYWLLSATAINEKGQIAASAYDYQDSTVRAVLLTPNKK